MSDVTHLTLQQDLSVLAEIVLWRNTDRNTSSKDSQDAEKLA